MAGRNFRTPLERAETAVQWRTARIESLQEQLMDYRAKLVEEVKLRDYLRADPRLKGVDQQLPIEPADPASVAGPGKPLAVAKGGQS